MKISKKGMKQKIIDRFNRVDIICTTIEQYLAVHERFNYYGFKSYGDLVTNCIGWFHTYPYPMLTMDLGENGLVGGSTGEGGRELVPYEYFMSYGDLCKKNIKKHTLLYV
jgi:hypothetical protein